MTDVHSKEVRSYNMSMIRSRDTKPEILLRKFLFSHSFRYKLWDKKLPGKPDIVLPKYKVAIFVHGCFWHGHAECNQFVMPKTRTDWWANKIKTNKKNDLRNLQLLRKLGWKVVVVWSCSLKGAKKEETFREVLRVLGKPAEKAGNVN